MCDVEGLARDDEPTENYHLLLQFPLSFMGFSIFDLNVQVLQPSIFFCFGLASHFHLHLFFFFRPQQAATSSSWASLQTSW